MHMELRRNKKIFFAAVIYLAIFTALLLIINMTDIRQWSGELLRVFRPIWGGLVLAYLCNPLFRLFERKLLYRLRPQGLRRALSLILTYLTVFLVIAILLMLIVPQLVASIQNFIENLDTSLENTVQDINAAIGLINARLPVQENGDPTIPLLTVEMVKDAAKNLLASINLDSAKVLNLLNQNLSTILEKAGDVIVLLADVVLAFFISLYMLVDKEKRYAQIMRLRRAFFSDKVNATITNICSTADRSFGGFLRGKILDSAIVGVLVYIAISLLGVPYAILIAVIVAITDIVPVIGPFIGVIPSAVIILLTDPGKVIPFLLCILIVQQIDGNIIAPKILGENTGVSSLCVMIAIITMGSIWGFAGMILGVPLFATVLELTSAWLDRRLQKKGLPTETDIYQSVEMVAAASADAPLPKRRKHSKSKIKSGISNGGEGDLSAFDRFCLKTHALAKKHGLFSHRSDEAIARFAEEQKELTEATENKLAQRAYEEHRDLVAEEESEKVLSASDAETVETEIADTEQPNAVGEEPTPTDPETQSTNGGV